jgi:hypothetical protein
LATYQPYAYSSTASTIPLTWQQWVGNNTVGTATSYTYADNATTWGQWVTAGSISHTTLTWQDEMWVQWEVQDYVYRRQRNQLTPEEQDELQRQREQRSREELAARQAREEQMAAARVRGRELLEELVDAGDWVPGLELIQLVGSDGQLYRVELHRDTVHGNVLRVDEHGCILGRACVAPEMHDGVRTLPTEDGWVGQYLGLKFDAEVFLQRANWSSVQGCREERRALPVAA